MISVAAIVSALAFWAPSNGGVPPCTTPSGSPAVQIGLYGPTGDIAGLGPASGYDGYAPEFGHPTCHIMMRYDAARYSARGQCVLMAHELGHARFILDDTDDRGNIMYRFTQGRPVPGLCYRLSAMTPKTHNKGG